MEDSFGFSASLIVFFAILGTQVCHGGILPDQDVQESRDTITLWPGGRIPYVIPEGSYSDFDKGVLLAAMKRWEEKTCIKFVPWPDSLQKDSEKDHYIKFYSEGSCFSKTGVYKYQPQLLGIGKRCLKLPTVIHELGHAIGLVHEMERVDRDWYIDIRHENLNAESAKNYATTQSRNLEYPLYRTPYDYKSIMHYGPKAWSSNNKPVIVTKDPAYQDVIGAATDVSFFDALYVNRAYNCSAKCSRSLAGLCRNGGFLGGPNCQCLCQDGYSGLFCDQPLPGFEKIVRWNCQKGWEFNAGKCYLFETKIITNYAAAKGYCSNRNSSLFVLKSRPEIEWIIKKTDEQKLLTTTKTLWIGLTTNQSVPNMKWEDGSFVDPNLVSVVDESSPTLSPKCARFNGESIVLAGCENVPDNGFICVKHFDARCGGRYTITRENTTIQSPGFPEAYPEDIECTYILQTDDNSRIQVTFTSFLLETNCKKDFVEVKLKYDVLADGQRYCGSQLNAASFTSEGNLLILKLNTDSRGTSTGFQATVTEVVSSAWTTPSPFSVLDSILNAFDEAKGRPENEQQRWTLRSLFEILKSFAFSKLL